MRFSNLTIAFSRFSAPLRASFCALILAFSPLTLPAQDGSVLNTQTSTIDQSQSSPFGQSGIGSSNSPFSSSSSSRSSSRSRRSSKSGTSQTELSSTANSGSSRRSTRERLKSATSANPLTGALGVGGTPDNPDRARAGQEKSTIVHRQAAGGAGKSGGGQTTPLPEIKMLAGTKENTLYFNPPQMTLNVGDELATSLEFYNADGASVDGLDLWVKYDPAALEPVWVELSALTTPAVMPAEASVWRDQGYIHILAPALVAPLGQTVNKIASLHWKALKPVSSTRVETLPPAGKQNELFASGVNVLETSSMGNRGRVSAEVHIIDPTLAHEALQLDNYGGKIAEVSQDPASRVRLAIIPLKPEVAPGQVSSADVMLVNPVGLESDTIRFRIRYDPKAVKILDADDGNYILNGINIFDGDFHEQFPFDYHAANSVDPDRGVIDYWMGSNGKSYAYPSGTVARIVFRMIRPSGDASFWFERADPLRGGVATDVTSAGRSLLGRDEAAAAEVLHGAKVSAAPVELAGR